MALDLSPIEATNLILAATILILGVWIYERKRETLALYVAAGFGLFALSHALTLLGYGDLQTVIIPIRVLGYLAVIAGLIILLLRTARVSQRGEPKVVESKQEVTQSTQGKSISCSMLLQRAEIKPKEVRSRNLSSTFQIETVRDMLIS